MPEYPSDVAFTPSVKAQQEKRGSREQYRRVEEGAGWQTHITPALADLVQRTRSFYIATASAEGQPYVQHRGGPPGFLRILHDRLLAFADYGGNRQYITLGNLAENPRVQLFIMDYSKQLRIKIWGRVRVVENDDTLLARVSIVAAAPPERVFVIDIEAWDRNCNRHIPLLVPGDDVAAAIRKLEDRITALEAENARLRGGGA